MFTANSQVAKFRGNYTTEFSRSFTSDPLKEITIRSGSSSKDDGGQIHKITRSIPHELYRTNDDDNDIAVFKVDPPFEFSATTQPLKLPFVDVPYDVEWGMVSGWGYFMVTKNSFF